MAEEEDDMPQCPLCLEELDSTDRAVEACQCGYQICLWCLHHIREQLNSRCPACRTPYQEQNFKYAQVNPEEAAKEAKERATAKKERERREKMKEIEKERARAAAVSLQKAKSNLKHARILQKNLVYVIGLSLTLAREEALRRADMFGKYGRMLRILVNRSHPFNADAPGGPSISAYVQYARDSDASAAVRAMNNAVLDGREIRCAIATTKYCDAFVRNAATSSDPTAAHYCGNQNCMYYHSLCTEETLTREEVLARQLGPPPPAHLFLPVHPNGRTANGAQSIHPRLAAHSVASGLVPANRATARSSALNSSVQPASSAPPSVLPPSSSLPSLPVPSVSANLATSQNPNASTGNLTIESSSPRRPLNSETHQPSCPNGTPPASPRETRKPSTRLQRSPASRDPAPSIKYPRSSPTSTSSKPLPVSSVPLPSSAGWASSQALSTSRSSPRRGQSSTFDDSSSLRPKLRLQSRRSREPSPPPGFENTTNNSTSGPLRPPGFDIPASVAPNDSKANLGRDRNAESESVKLSSKPTVAPPPGFGPTTVSQPTDDIQTKVTDVAAAWAQEAASDKVFSGKEKRHRNDFVGQVGGGTSPVPQDTPDSRSDLAQVLAKLGGDLGVASEIRRMQNVQSNAMQAKAGRYTSNAIGSDRSTKFASAGTVRLGSLFGNQTPSVGYSVPSTPFPSSTTGANPIVPPSTPAYGTAFASTFASSLTQKSLTSRVSQVPMASPRRNTSRFVFAQRDGAADIPQTKAPRSASFQPRSTSCNVSSSLPTLTSSATPSEMFRRGQAVRDVRQEPPFMSDLFQATKHASTAAQGALRQNRSRFDFVDHGTHSQNTKYPPRSIRGNGNMPAKNISPVGRGRVNQNDSIASLAQLSTQEKLASIFNSAQMSGEALPPMPAFDAHADPLANPNISVIPSKPVALDDSHRSFRAASRAGQLVAKEKSRIPDVMHPRQSSMPPPGFREATPGISPESTKVENVSTTSGVAKSVASGGDVSISRKENNALGTLVEESMSSGTDSHEDDRRKTRTQRRREKKGRHAKDSTERNSNGETKHKSTGSISSTAAVHPVQVTQPVKVTQPHQAVHPTKGAPQFQAPQAQPAQPIKVTKPVQQVPRNRGNGEVESLRAPPSKSMTPPRLNGKESVLEKEQNSSEAKASGKICNEPLAQKSNDKSGVAFMPSKLSEDPGKYMSVSELEREVEAARAREAHLQDKLLELQRRIRSYDNVRT